MKTATSCVFAATLLAGCVQHDVEGAGYNAGRSGIAYTWAGVTSARGFGSESSDSGDGQPIRESWLYFVEDLTFAPDGHAWVVDWNNHRVRRVEWDGTFATVIGTDYEGDGPPGETDRLPLGNPPGCKGTDVALNHPTDIKFMPDGTAVLAAWHNNKIRTFDPKTGLVKVLAGDSYGYTGDGQPAYMAVFNQPKAIAIDEAGRIYTNDQRNERIRMIDVDAQRTITTIAGSCVVERENAGTPICDKGTELVTCPGSYKVTMCKDVATACKWVCTPGTTGDGGPALAAQFGFDSGVTPHPSGALALRGRELFVADTLGNTIRRIDLDTGLIECVAGDGCPIQFTFNYPMDLEFGPDGRLYVADRFANAIEAINLDSGSVERVAGNGQACSTTSTTCVETGEGHTALEIQLNQPYGLTFDQHGDMYIADSHNSRIVRIAK